MERTWRLWPPVGLGSATRLHVQKHEASPGLKGEAYREDIRETSAQRQRQERGIVLLLMKNFPFLEFSSYSLSWKSGYGSARWPVCASASPPDLLKLVIRKS